MYTRGKQPMMFRRRRFRGRYRYVLSDNYGFFEAICFYLRRGLRHNVSRYFCP